MTENKITGWTAEVSPDNEELASCELVHRCGFSVHLLGRNDPATDVTDLTLITQHTCVHSTCICTIDMRDGRVLDREAGCPMHDPQPTRVHDPSKIGARPDDDPRDQQ